MSNEWPEWLQTIRCLHCWQVSEDRRVYDKGWYSSCPHCGGAYAQNEYPKEGQ